MTDAAHPLLEHALRFKVRTYELDQNGHVNNAVYLAWTENLAAEHAEALGFGRAWSGEQGGGWVVRHHEITYHVAAVAGDEVDAVVRVEALGGVRGTRRTWFRRAADAAQCLDAHHGVHLVTGYGGDVVRDLVMPHDPAAALLPA
ncbi:MAG TPA: acyl-CoA thioesterase, partial [Candidatus Limnocylindria bacterium]|nr:acyl-CoA thioesterase [Candidatus Limnocylindria bacterium]